MSQNQTVNKLENIIKQLIEYKIFEVNIIKQFELVSGLSSPIYCDLRKLLYYPKLRNDVATMLADNIKQNYPQTELICGVATGSIAISVLVAQILELPFIYHRKPKGYGHNKTVEGQYDKGQKVIVIEDVITTGKSALQAIRDIKSNGLEVLNLLAIYTHNPKSNQWIEDENLKPDFLFNLSKIIEHYQQLGDKEVVKCLEDFALQLSDL
jgi:orotate phosphoribosyltransferase